MNQNKPISLLIREFKNNIDNAINNSNLPISIINYIMQVYCSEINVLTQQFEEKEIQEYLNSTKEKPES